MNNHLSKPHTIAVLRALNLGDLLCAIPVFRSLRTAFPSSHITLIGLPWAQEFATRFESYFDEFIEFPGFPGLPEQPIQPQKITSFLNHVQKKNFDLVIQMHGQGNYTNTCVQLFGAKQMAGFYPRGSAKPDGLFFPYPRQKHEIVRHAQLMESLGMPVDSLELEFPLKEKDYQEFEVLSQQYSLKTNYVVIHAGAQDPRRRWEVKNFSLVADFIAKVGYQVVLTGTEKETELVDELQQTTTHPVINLAGKTSLGSLGALLQNARLLIANDTGVSHVAAALKTPSVIVFSNYSKPSEWAPLDYELHTVITAEQTQYPINAIETVNEKLKSKIKVQKSETKLLIQKQSHVFEV